MRCLMLDPLHIVAAVVVFLLLVVLSFAAGAEWGGPGGEP